MLSEDKLLSYMNYAANELGITCQLQLACRHAIYLLSSI